MTHEDDLKVDEQNLMMMKEKCNADTKAEEDFHNKRDQAPAGGSLPAHLAFLKDLEDEARDFEEWAKSMGMA